MRRGLTGLALAIVLGAASCSGSGSPSASAPVAACPTADRPAVSLLTEPRREPSATGAACLARTYTNIVASPAWTDLPKQVGATSDKVFTWQRRVLQYGFEPCRQCPRPGVDLAMVRAQHPEWILHDANGNEIHPVGHTDWVLFDFSNVEFQAAWGAAVAAELSGSRWTGVDIVDATNVPNWSSQPIDPATHAPMTEASRRVYLAEALSVVRAAMKTSGFSLVAFNGPPSIIDRGQIASTDAVDVGLGFARLTGSQWDVLFQYFQETVETHVGAWVQDLGRLTRSQRIYGLASYLLVSGPFSSYGVDSGTESSLYDVALGDAVAPAQAQGGVWVRTFAGGYVAVNPSSAAGSVTLPDGTAVDVAAGGAVIQTQAALYSTAA
jgi:hypothetical protein